MLTHNSLLAAIHDSNVYGIGQHRFGASSRPHHRRQQLMAKPVTINGKPLNVEFDDRGRVKTLNIATGKHVWVRLR